MADKDGDCDEIADHDVCNEDNNDDNIAAHDHHRHGNCDDDDGDDDDGDDDDGDDDDDEVFCLFRRQSASTFGLAPTAVVFCCLHTNNHTNTIRTIIIDNNEVVI